jgi:DNA-binding CsgD family transcriptional regulator
MSSKNQNGANGRPPQAVVTERERQAWEMTQAGHTQAEIAEALGVTQSAVSKMLDRVNNRVLEELGQAVLARKMRQLDRLDYLYDEAMAAWERSKQPETVVSYEAPRAGRRREVTVKTLDGRCGDPVFLRRAMDALAEIRKILGLNAAEPFEFTPIADPEEQSQQMITPTEDDLAAALVHLYEAGHPRVVEVVQDLANGGDGGTS